MRQPARGGEAVCWKLLSDVLIRRWDLKLPGEGQDAAGNRGFGGEGKPLSDGNQASSAVTRPCSFLSCLKWCLFRINPQKEICGANCLSLPEPFPPLQNAYPTVQIAHLKSIRPARVFSLMNAHNFLCKNPSTVAFSLLCPKEK